MPKPVEASAHRQAIGYLYAVWWMYKFYLRQNIIGRYVKYPLVGLFIIELLGPITHLLPIANEGRSQYAITSGLIACAGILVWHHARLHKRVNRHSVVLSSTMVLLEEQSLYPSKQKPHGQMKIKSDVINILDTFVFALEDYYSKQPFAASLVVRHDGADRFTIYAQDSRDEFHPTTELNRINSVAGATANESHGTLLYVPRTSCVHALRIAAEQTDHRRYRTARIIPNAFEMLQSDPPSLRSLLCVRVPLADARQCAIVSLSTADADGFGDLEFQAIKVAGALISRVLG